MSDDIPLTLPCKVPPVRHRPNETEINLRIFGTAFAVVHCFSILMMAAPLSIIWLMGMVFAVLGGIFVPIILVGFGVATLLLLIGGLMIGLSILFCYLKRIAIYGMILFSFLAGITAVFAIPLIPPGSDLITMVRWILWTLPFCYVPSILVGLVWRRYFR